MDGPSIYPGRIGFTASKHTEKETYTVTIPRTGTFGHVDVYFVADNTGSMSDVIKSVSEH